MKYYCEDSQQVLQELNSQKSGLTEKEAAERLLQNGANELKAAKGKSLLRRFAEQVADPMIVILLAAAAISGVLAVLENDSFADVIIILAVVLINAVLGVYQESKAEKAIEALQEVATPADDYFPKMDKDEADRRIIDNQLKELGSLFSEDE